MWNEHDRHPIHRDGLLRGVRGQVALAFRNDWQALIAELQAVYGTVGMKLPELDSDDAPGDIDPFTVFGLFNKGITDANLKRIAVGVASEFGAIAAAG